MPAGRRLPDLGPRGEGWFAIQVALFAAIAIGGLTGPAWSGPLRDLSILFGTALIAVGGLLAARAIIDLGGNLTPFPRPRAGATLVATGAYSLVRHPIYGGGIIAAFGWGLATASLASLAGALVLTVFFDLKSRREEAWLAAQIDGYSGYRSRTRRLLPWLY